MLCVTLSTHEAYTYKYTIAMDGYRKVQERGLTKIHINK